MSDPKLKVIYTLSDGSAVEGTIAQSVLQLLIDRLYAMIDAGTVTSFVVWDGDEIVAQT